LALDETHGVDAFRLRLLASFNVFLIEYQSAFKLSTIRWCDMSVSHSFEPRFLFVQFAWSGARHSLTGCGIPKQDACLDGALDL
jgi:hypothetical protein